MSSQHLSEMVVYLTLCFGLMHFQFVFDVSTAGCISGLCSKLDRLISACTKQSIFGLWHFQILFKSDCISVFYLSLTSQILRDFKSCFLFETVGCISSFLLIFCNLDCCIAKHVLRFFRGFAAPEFTGSLPAFSLRL